MEDPGVFFALSGGRALSHYRNDFQGLILVCYEQRHCFRMTFKTMMVLSEADTATAFSVMQYISTVASDAVQTGDTKGAGARD